MTLPDAEDASEPRDEIEADPALDMLDMIIREEQVYRPAEVARVLRVSVVTVSRMIRGGRLKAFRVGGQWRILGSDLVRCVSDETEGALRGVPSSRNGR